MLCAPWKCGSSYWRQLVVKLHGRHDEDWSDRRVRGNDPVYQPPSQPERHQLLNSPDTVAVIVARHPFIRLISAWNEKLNRNYQYGHSMFHREHNLRHYARDHVSSHYIRCVSVVMFRSSLLLASAISPDGLHLKTIATKTNTFDHNRTCARHVKLNMDMLSR